MAVTAREQPTELKIHGNHRRSSLCCVIGIRSFTSAALQCGDIPVRPVGTPTNIPVTSRPKEESSSCKIHYQQSGLFLLGGACHGEGGEKRGAAPECSLCARSCPHTGTSSRQHGCLLAPRLERGGREFWVRLHSTFSEPLLLNDRNSSTLVNGRCGRL